MTGPSGFRLARHGYLMPIGNETMGRCSGRSVSVPPRAHFAAVPIQPHPESDGIVVPFVARGVEQRDRAAPRLFEDNRRGFARRGILQLSEIFRAKRIPFVGMAVKALAQ